MNDELDLRENLQFFENETGPSEGVDSLPPGITPAVSKFIQQAIADTVQDQSKNKIDDPSGELEVKRVKLDDIDDISGIYLMLFRLRQKAREIQIQMIVHQFCD